MTSSSNGMPIVKYIEPRTLTLINLTPESPLSSLRKSDQTEEDRISTAHPHLLMANIAHQLHLRRLLQTRLGFINDMMCCLGLLGIVLMVIENEITFSGNNNIDTIVSWLMKLIMSVSTTVLVGLLIFYHYLNFKLYAARNSVDDWRVELTLKRIFLIGLELIVCAIHPMPRRFPSNWTSTYQEIHVNANVVDTFAPSSVYPSYIATDVALGLPMFARLYLVCRCIIYHSHLVRDAPLKSFGSLNRVPINFTFLIKTYLEQWPTRCLSVFCFLMFLIGSWSIRACEYKSTVMEHISMFDAMWLFIITFTTVGYGDFTPTTFCGRSITSIVALIGVLVTALLITVIAQKLALSRWERYVHHFVSDIELSRDHREQAANVIKFAIKIWYLKRQDHLHSFEYFQTQRMLFTSIHTLQKLKQKQRRLNDDRFGLVELINSQRYTNLKTKRIARELTTIKSTVEKMEGNFQEMTDTIHQMHHTLNLLLNKTVKM